MVSVMDTAARPAHPPAKRRKVFLQTMGEQLRELNVQSNGTPENTSNHSRALPSIGARLAGEGEVRTGGVPHIATPESDDIPGDTTQLSPDSEAGASKDLWDLVETSSYDAESLNPPSFSFSFDDFLSWSNGYFTYWHPAYPLLHAPTVLDMFRNLAKNSFQSWDNLRGYQRSIIQSIMSISLADRRQTRQKIPPVPSRLVFASFKDAIASIQQALIDESSIEALQAVTAVQLFLLSMLRYNAASRLAGLSARIVLRLGLHRCPSHYAMFSTTEIDVRKRLFFSIFCIDRFICSRLGLPPAIRDEDLDVCLPGTEEHQGVGHDVPSHDGRLNFTILLSKHAKLRGHIILSRSRSTIKSGTTSTETSKLHVELVKWWNEVEECFDVEHDTRGSAMTPYQRTVLSVLRYESIIALSRDVIGHSQMDSEYSAALQNCITAARSIINSAFSLPDTPDPLYWDTVGLEGLVNMFQSGQSQMEPFWPPDMPFPQQHR